MNGLQIHLLSKYIADLFWVAVTGVKEKWEAEAENSSGKKCREHGNFLPTNLNPRIHKEADCKHDERNEAYKHQHNFSPFSSHNIRVNMYFESITLLLLMHCHCYCVCDYCAVELLYLVALATSLINTYLLPSP